MSKTFGLLLAGGKSSRMKTDKALLKMGNYSLFERALSTLNNTALDDVIISGEKHGGIADKLPAKGPFSGIHAAVMSAHMVNGDRLLVLPVDTPFVSIKMLNTLITHSRRSQQSCFYAASYLPLCLVMNERLQQYLKSVEQQRGSYRIERLLDAINANAMQIDEPSALMNINCPIDLMRARKQSDLNSETSLDYA